MKARKSLLIYDPAKLVLIITIYLRYLLIIKFQS